MESRQEIIAFVDKRFQGIGSPLGPLELLSLSEYPKDTRDRKLEHDYVRSYFEHSNHHTKEFDAKAHDASPLQHHHTQKLASGLISFVDKYRMGDTGYTGPIEDIGATGAIGATGPAELTGNIEAPSRYEKVPTMDYGSYAGELLEEDDWEDTSDGNSDPGEKKKGQGQGQGQEGSGGRGEGGEGNDNDREDKDNEDYVHVTYPKSCGYSGWTLVEVERTKNKSLRDTPTRGSPPWSSSSTDVVSKEAPSYEDDLITI